MDIGITQFTDFLPFILSDISSSCFVSIDFELSGLAFPPNAPQINTPTVQERYLEGKEAAERYQILQVGLTICHENPKSGTYTLKPYNFNISPMTQPGTDVDRDWVFGSRSMRFLLANGFSIDTTCSAGIQYLSRVEEESAIQSAVQKCRSRSPVPDIGIQEDDPECLAFLQSSRLAIDNWLAQGKNRQGWLNIPPPTSLLVVPSEIPGGLSNGQKRLVHQLVSVEYPGLKSRGAPSFVQIEPRDPDSERLSFEARLKERKARIRNHVGFRWIVEALVGGNLDELDPECFMPMLNQNGNPVLQVRQLSDRVKARLKQNRPVLVGHNMFFDLLFLYRCFIGPLPNTLQEFNALIHEMFPTLADTKYLATHDCGVLARDSSLEDLNRNLAHIQFPTIEIDPRFTKYKFRKRTHEAGYDSLLTAMIFIKLAGNLQRSPAIFLPKGQHQPAIYSTVNVPPPSLFASAMQELDRRKAANAQNSHFCDAENEKSLELDEELFAESIKSLEDTGDRQITLLANRGMLVPRLGTIFWANYGNKLRVFGTQERVIQVNEHQARVGLLIDI